MKNALLLLCLIIGTSFIATSQISINEYSASNLESFVDQFEKTEDWIELYNANSTDTDIGGYFLSDKVNKPMKWEIPSGTIIPARGYMVFYCSGRDLVANGEYHTNFKLKQTSGKDQVVLTNPAGDIVESIEMTITLTEHAMSKGQDGSADWVVTTAPTPNTSNNNAPQYNGYTNAPSMDIAAGFYKNRQEVELINNEPDAVIRFTTNGNNPTESSALYTGPISVLNTRVIKARAFSNDPKILPGKMIFNTYFINEEYSLPVFSVAADLVLGLAAGEGELIPIGSLEYFNENQEREAVAFGSLNRHGQDSWVLDHRSLDWVTRDEMGYTAAVDAKLFNYSDRDEYQKFMFRNSGDDNYPAIDDEDHEGSTHIRDEYVQQLSLDGKMKLDLRANERVILFLNGRYWGVYGMRERPVDHDYTDEYYDQGKYDIQYLSTWGNTEIEYGGQQAKKDWEEIRDFVLENDMSNEDNYQKVDDNINLLSLIDYMLVNLNVVASDWLNYNTGWWRGLNEEGDHKKWGYILWDLDATFDYYINYTGVPNIAPDADPCDLEIIGEEMDYFFGDQDSLFIIPNPEQCQSIINGTSPYPADDEYFILTTSVANNCCENWDFDCGFIYDGLESGEFEAEDFVRLKDVGRHEKIFLKLLEENEDFKKLYYGRYADLMNTVYDCDNMLTTLDSMLAIIDPEMDAQINRWGGTRSEWERNVEDLQEFIRQRCTMLDDGALECYDELSGPYNITLLTKPNGIGEIDFNTLDIEQFPWTGDYFGGTSNKIKAKVFDEYADDYVFSHWESRSGHMISPSINDRKAEITMTEPDTLIAVFASATDVNDISQTIDARVYPNPASDVLNIEITLDKTELVNINLISVAGQKVWSSTQQYPNGKQQIQVPLTANITPGFYLLRITSTNGEGTFKVSIVD